MTALFSLVHTDPTDDDIDASIALARAHTGRRTGGAFRCSCGHIEETAMGIARHRHRLLITHARKDPR